MKINVYGGALTISYNLAKFLKRSGQDVTLFIDKKLYDESYSPVWEDEDLRYSYPKWIKVTDASFRMSLLGNRQSKRFASLLTDCDILHLHGEAYLWANLFNKCFIYHSYGYDLDQMPFKKDTIKSKILSFFSRRGIKRAEKIVIAPHQKIFLERLKVAHKSVYLPFPIDTEKYKCMNVEGLRNKLLSSYKVDFIFFSPSRHELVTNSTGNKGNDKVLFAFASYMKETRNKALLILVNKGRDVTESRKLIERLRIGKNVIWLEPMPKAKLIEYYSISDLVFDQFSVGSFGQIFLESMSCGKPTFIYLKGYEEFYPQLPPAINVYTCDEILENLIKLTANKEKMINIGESSRNWIKQYHDWPKACESFLTLYNSILRNVNY